MKRVIHSTVVCDLNRWDESTGRFAIISDDCTLHEGPIAYTKGQDVAQQQLATQNALTQQQLAAQAALRAQIMGSVGQYLTPQGQGFDPQQKAIMQSQFLDQNAAAGKQAGQNVMGQLAARGGAGGALPVGGDFARSLEGLQGQIATSQSQGILGTNLADLQQSLNNRFNAASVASGQSAQLGQNIGTFNSGASNSLDQYVKAVNAPGFMSALGQGIGSGLGDMATGGISGSLGGLTSMLKGGKFGAGFGNPFSG